MNDGRYALAHPESIGSEISMNYEFNIFGSVASLVGRTHLTYEPINDAPVEKEIPKFNWGGWLCNLAAGLLVTVAVGALAFVAVTAVIATGGMVLGAAALVGATLGAGITTASIAISDLRSGHVRSFGEAMLQTAMGTIGGAVSGALIYGAYTLIPFFAEAAGNAGIYYFGGALGGNAVTFIQSAATIAGFGLVGTDAIYAVDKIAEIGLKEDILLETIFNGNETSYADFEMLLMMGNMFYFETGLTQKKLSESGKKHPKYDNLKAAEETRNSTEGVSETEGFLPDEYYSGNYSSKPPLIKDSVGNVKLYRTVSEAEYSSLMNGEPFNSVQGTMESKWFSTTIEDAHAWGNKMDFGGNYRIIEITVPETVIDGLYYGGPNLDGIGPAYNGVSDVLNQFLDSIRSIY